MSRGGPRKPGPGKIIGRPKLEEKRVKISITVRQDHADYLLDKNNSEEIEKALDEYLK